MLVGSSWDFSFDCQYILSETWLLSERDTGNPGDIGSVCRHKKIFAFSERERVSGLLA